MTIDDQIKDEKLQYDINITFNQKQIIKKGKFTYSPLGKTNKNN